MTSLIKKLMQPIKPKQEQPLTVSQLYHYKSRFACLGTVGSGKTTVAAAMFLTAQTMSSERAEFRCRILEGSSGIRVAVSNLRRGYFPPKTPVDSPVPYEAGLLLSWSSLIGERKLQIPICDISGEEVQGLIQKFGAGMYPTQEAFNQLTTVIRYVQDADGFILVLPAARALFFPDDAKLEKEPEGIAIDPDVNLARILDSVFQHKEQSGGKKIKAIAVCITKWDLVQPFARAKNMDIYDPTGQGLTNFMNVCFPDTMASLKAYGLSNVRFFPSYIQVQRESDGKISTWSDGQPKIELSETMLRMPKYSEQSYVQLFDYLKSFAT